MQFLKKVNGFNTPSQISEAAFLAAIDDIAMISRNLLISLQTNAPPRNRAKEPDKARACAAKRFPT